MSEVSSSEKIRPPRLIPSLMEGFNAVASRIFIILFPIGIDLLLWFGPLVRIKEMIFPIFKNAVDLSVPGLEEEALVLLSESLDLWEQFLTRLNLLASLRTFPVGVPSLMLSVGPLKNPLGSPIVFEIHSFSNAVGFIFILTIIGLIMGAFYYEIITRAVLKDEKKFHARSFQKSLVQSTILFGIIFLSAIILGVPLICLLSTVAFLLPSLGTFPFMAALFLLVWVLLPLVFSGHGIFFDNMKAIQSITISVRIVRRLMTPVGLFLLAIIMLGYGLNSLWMTPPADSWMLLVGIFGHSFISSGLLAASFVFYRDGLNWFQASTSKIKENSQPDIP